MKIPAAFALLAAASALMAADPAASLDFNLYMQGRYVYERNCIVCHGARGDGNGELSPTLKPKPRSFREGMFKFRSTPQGFLPTDADLRRTITGGLSGTAMGMFTQLSSEEIVAVITYVKSFSRRWRKPENHAQPVKLSPPPEWLKDPVAFKTHAQAGQKLFTTNCTACHGDKADGKGPAAIALKDIWGIPAAPSDLRQPHLRCGDSPADVFRVLTTGLNGTPMVSFDKTLTEAQRWDIIAHIFSIRLPSGPVLGAAAAKE
ncbi:cytochrome c [Prosthecobacter sp.]|uniref:c-type cytochrome n=1 Tax=Prosthecobacter sp. TaxID=1965333 RepID=UPI002AB9AEA9|nr:cytochrome c [Prosthecobacter sp.]MDZ4402714.1 cytochrome c [Prosthecobacter sp.]